MAMRGKLTFEPVETDAQIAEAARVAHDIWFEYWPARIGQAQTAYMVQTMQSEPAIAADIREKGYRYWLLSDEAGTHVGYTCALVEDYTADPVDPAAAKHGAEVSKRALRRLFISKIYLYAPERGKHYASRVIEFYEDLCRAEVVPAMYLTVNRGNDLAIRAYRGRGFETVDVQDADIGGGFVMNDYIMLKEVAGA